VPYAYQQHEYIEYHKLNVTH